LAVGLAVLSMILKLILHKQETQGMKFRRESLGALSDRRYGRKVLVEVSSQLRQLHRKRRRNPNLRWRIGKRRQFRKKKRETNLVPNIILHIFLTPIFMGQRRFIFIGNFWWTICTNVILIYFSYYYYTVYIILFLY